MTKDQAIRIALEALEKDPAPLNAINNAKCFLYSALEQPEQEPVTWRNAAIRLGEDLYSVGPNGYYNMTASQWLDWALSVVNTAPPRREWVELTFEEADRLASKYSSGFRSDHNDALHLVGEVEALLKEKNT